MSIRPPANPSSSGTTVAFLNWFDVTEYGAVADCPVTGSVAGATDCRVAINAALQAAFDAGGGVVFFPQPAEGLCYLVNGALDPTFNSLLVVPKQTMNVASTNQLIVIELVGGGPAAIEAPWVSGAADALPTTSGVIIRTTKTGSGTYPAVIAGAAYGAIYPNASLVAVAVKNITLRLPVNPSIGGFRFDGITAFVGENFAVTVDGSAQQIEEAGAPSSANAVGLSLPANSNGATNRARGYWTTGMYEGLWWTEHANVDDIAFMWCSRAIRMPSAGHPSMGGRVSIQNCPRGIVVTGSHKVTIQLLQFEHGQTSSDWGQVVYDIDDASNNLKGEIVTHATTGGVGTVVDTVANGAENVRIVRLDTMRAIGKAGPAMEVISSSVLSAPAATFDFTSIPSNYDSLRIEVMARGDAPATNVEVRLTFNNDPGANYDWEVGIAAGSVAPTSAAGTGSAYVYVGSIPAATVVSRAGMVIIDIPMYALAAFFKVLAARNAESRGTNGTDQFTRHSGGQWRSTAPISRVTLTPSAGNFDTGSTATLYGLRN